MAEKKKYHINPDTGRPNICQANVRGCKYAYDGYPVVHYDSKEEAQKAAEQQQESLFMNTDQRLNYLEKIIEKQMKDNDTIEYSLSVIDKDETIWSPAERENLLHLEKIVELSNKKDFDNSDLDQMKYRLDHMQIYNHGGKLKRDNTSVRINGEYLTIDRFNEISYIAKSFYIKKYIETKNNNLPDPAPRENNENILPGLHDSQKTTLMNANIYDSYYKGNGFSYEELELDKNIDRIIANQTLDYPQDIVDNPMDIATSIVPKKLRLLKEFSNKDDNQLYLGTVFPEKYLAPTMKKAGIKNVKVDTFYNNREYGNVYTVNDPYGNTKSFSIYEHRNSDSIIINGRTNWDKNDPKDNLPYSADNKNAFFAEFGGDDYSQVAESLTFFLSEAQKGDLDNDKELVDKAEHRDWRAILNNSIPGFKEWMDKNFGEEEKNNNDPRYDQ